MSARRLIVNADDLGYDPAVTTGILRAMREGVVSSATFMVNTPFSDDAAREARRTPGLALGLHLNLARWAPVSGDIRPALLADGVFTEALVSRLSPEEVAVETVAQLERLTALLGAPATHIDVHKHLHRNPAVLEGVVRVAAERGLPVRALDAEMRHTLRGRGVRTPDAFVGDAGGEAYWTLERWQAALGGLAPGVTELMCHPGLAPSHVRSGYGAQREVELATFLAPEARRALERSGVEPITFRSLQGAEDAASP